MIFCVFLSSLIWIPSALTSTPQQLNQMQIFHGGGGLEQNQLKKYNEYLIKQSLMDLMTALVNKFPPNCIQLNAQMSTCLRCPPADTLKYGICVPKAKFCQDFSSDGLQCLKCNSELIPRGGKCVGSLDNCEIISIDNPSQCLLCKVNYTLTDFGCMRNKYVCTVPIQNGCGQCVENNFFNEQRSCLSQTIYACRRFSRADNRCLQCFDNYKPVKGQCVPYAEIETQGPNPLRYESRYSVPVACKVMNYDGCIECQPNYHVSEGFCQPNVFFCEAYDDYGECKKCAPGTTFFKRNNMNIYDRVTSFCYKRCIVDLTNCEQSYPDFSECNVCQKGYYKTNGGCALISQVCEDYDQTLRTCLESRKDFYMTDYQSFKSKTLSTCLIWGKSGKCYSCINPTKYFLNFGQCLPICYLRLKMY